MKNLIIISAIVGVLFYHPYDGFTQGKDVAVDIEQIDGYNQLLKNQNNLELLSKAIVIQIGDENSAFVKQQGLNAITTRQVGVLNSLNVVQSGFGGHFTLYQNGELNHYQGELNGNNLEALITQNGNSNTINQQVSGDHSLFEIIQDGQHNSIINTSNSLSAPDLKVQQRGNKMQLIIKSN